MSPRSGGQHFAVLSGTTIIVAGIVLLLTQLFGVRFLTLGWPVLVIVPGVLMLASAYSVPRGNGLGYLAIPAMVLIVTGGVLEVQALSGDWAS